LAIDRPGIYWFSGNGKIREEKIGLGQNLKPFLVQLPPFNRCGILFHSNRLCNLAMDESRKFIEAWRGATNSLTSESAGYPGANQLHPCCGVSQVLPT
jgi:hypothetical protein